MERWYTVQRPTVYVENGKVKAFNFSVIDVQIVYLIQVDIYKVVEEVFMEILNRLFQTHIHEALKN